MKRNPHTKIGIVAKEIRNSYIDNLSNPIDFIMSNVMVDMNSTIIDWLGQGKTRDEIIVLLDNKYNCKLKLDTWYISSKYQGHLVKLIEVDYNEDYYYYDGININGRVVSNDSYNDIADKEFRLATCEDVTNALTRAIYRIQEK